MSKFIDKLSEDEIIEAMTELYDCLNVCKNRKEIHLVFRDLLTIKEKLNIHRRIIVAFMLKKGFSFGGIAQRLGVGAQKITNVSRAMERHGEGFEIIFNQLENIKIKRKKQKLRNQKPTKGFIRGKYKGAFLLLDLLDEIDIELRAKNEIKNEFDVKNK
ncbi:MAG: Trp family transcriptional regulator [Patescibacteria group bacterium]